MFHQWQQHDPEHRPRVARTRTGCLTCRRRKVRCNEVHPRCGHCTRLRLACSWPPDSSFTVPGIETSKSKPAYLNNRGKRQRQRSRSQSPPQKQQPLQQSQQLSELPPPQQQSLPEADFNEIFNYASFLWDNDSSTLPFPTASSPLDVLNSLREQPHIPILPARSETGRRTVQTSCKTPRSPGDRWLSGDASLSPEGSSVNISETDLSELFAHSNAPPILAPVETSFRWSRMRKMLVYMCQKSDMVKNAVMAFAALQLDSPGSRRRTIYAQYYAFSRDMLTKLLAKVTKDQNLLTVELNHILATIFLLTYIDLLDDDVYKAHGNLRDAFQRSVYYHGCDYLMAVPNLLLDMESPPETLSGGLEDAETVLEDVLSRPAYSFFQKVQSFMGRISRIDPWHRSRGTVEDETEVMIIAQKISKDIKALWLQRPPLMDHAIACKLVPPFLSPSLANNLTRMLMVCYANYHACFVHLHRVAYKNLPRTPELDVALCAIQEVTENIIRTPLGTSNSVETLCDFSPGSPLPINMLWPLLMLGVESDDTHQRAWVIAAMKRMESIVSNAGITADVLEEVIRRQDETGQRVDIRQVMHDTFTRVFAIV
ncbi:hypothetical protein UA08_00265 [Talaromyces atroroseus]|uniref:Zn(2)-C6 fungal-type domain-containing protein n=1 Tax=Talaromyces atroroseus TaxID=1441469 RepID=A0A225BC61_TALAT|nr:hypothetical protein UA08_00265 [Talaromyces atroroseus]OKL63637.1 hypothetical protein UA08_00265 [Talaromyces atroroseus]